MSNRFACVLGSNGPTWDTRLEFAEKDADRIHSTLQDQCGFTVYRTHPNGDAHDAMREVLRVAALCKSGDDLIIYFSGHGVLHAGRLFLLWKTTAKTIFDSAIPARPLVEALELSAATNKLLVLDCCHAGGAVGFKSNAALEPVLTDGGSQLVLCASNRLELAREFKKFEGSFLAFHVSTILESTTKLSISLVDLVDQLKKRAVDNNSVNPQEQVPIPFLFGKDRASSFLIKRPKDKQPVELRVRSLFEPDMDRFRFTMGPYERWQPQVLRGRLPVEIALPAEFIDRTRVLADYVSTDKWPGEVADHTKKHVKFMAEQLLPELEHELIQAVRIVSAAAFSESGENLDAARDAILESYISAKLFATARSFDQMWLQGETREVWTEQSEELEPQERIALIFGLTWVSHELIQVSVSGFTKNPEEFNSPLGFLFFEALDDASRNAALCSGNATNAVIGNILDKKVSNYESGMRLAQSCIDVSTLFYTISESAGALYSRYVESLQQTARLGADTATKCADILKKQGVLPKK
jgi:Caspase domain